MTKAMERLEEMLDEKEAELTAAQEKITQLQRTLDGSLDGWRFASDSVDVADDETLPVPRLEVVYKPMDGWRDSMAVYRLVLRHLMGGLYAVPIGWTRCRGGLGEPPAPKEVPYRDGAHAHHDSAFLRLPLYQLVPDRAPLRIDDDENFKQQRATGAKHRRE